MVEHVARIRGAGCARWEFKNGGNGSDGSRNKQRFTIFLNSEKTKDGRAPCRHWDSMECCLAVCLSRPLLSLHNNTLSLGV